MYLHKKNYKGNNGYTLLFAVLVSSLVLAVGISILTISKKEFLLITSARDSSVAFYAADGGLECAVYSDAEEEDPLLNTFSTSTLSNINNISCVETVAGDQIGNKTSNWNPSTKVGTFTFDLKLGGMGASCAKVVVTKEYRTDPEDPSYSYLSTTFDSRGYNMGWNTVTKKCELQTSRRVERALQLEYSI